MRTNFISALFLLASIPGLTQQKDVHGVYWLRYNNQLHFSKDFFWSNEFDNRRFTDPDVQTQFIFHSRLHLKKGRWDYGTGVSLSWAYASSPEQQIKHPTLEVRPVIEASYEIPIRKWLLQQRLRIDNRIFEEDKFESIFDGSIYVIRFRYRLQARIPLHYNSTGAQDVTLRIADEIMANHKENFFDQNRIYASLDFLLHKNLSIEGGYLYIYQQRFGKDEFFHRHVFRFSLIHRLLFY